MSSFRVNSLLAASLLALVSSTACAQDPGPASDAPPASAVTQPDPPVEAPSAFQIVDAGGARARAQEFIASKGWSVGWDVDKGWGVWIGEASLTAADPTGLSLAMMGAQLDAKFQFAEYLAGVTENYTLSMSEKNPAQRKAEQDRMDKLAAKPGGDPVAAGIRDLLASVPTDADSGVAFRTRISTASKTAAQAAIPGMLTVAAFVVTDESGLDGTATVVMVSTPRSRQMADAMLGRATAPAGGKSGMKLQDYVNSLSAEALVYSCGATYRTNERGELCLLGFGVAAVDGTESEEITFATDEAKQAATADLRSVAGELVEGFRLMSKAAEKTKYVDGKVQSESSKSFSSRISTMAKALQIPGIIDVATKRVRHPVLGDLVCVVRAWNLTDAKNAANLRAAFNEQGGWRGGDGVQPDRGASKGVGAGKPTDPAMPRKPGVPSGSGGGGIEEDE
jgi:hypothetical protein